ncbi:MAG: hypothetical protein V2A67_04480 [Bacteroidota bacterium]
MDFHQKQAAYQELKGEQFLESDRSMLERLRPYSKVFKALRNPDRVQVQEKILWELLDVALPDEIRSNWGSKPSASSSSESGAGNQDKKKKRTAGTGKARKSTRVSSKGSRVSKH